MRRTSRPAATSLSSSRRTSRALRDRDRGHQETDRGAERRAMRKGARRTGCGSGRQPAAARSGDRPRPRRPVPTCRFPEWLFGWAAAIVLIVSFVALAVLWPEPKLEGEQGWRLFRAPGRAGHRAPLRQRSACFTLGRARSSRARRRADRRRGTWRRLRLRHLLGRPRVRQRPVRRHLQGVQPVAGDRPRRGRASRS